MNLPKNITYQIANHQPHPPQPEEVQPNDNNDNVVPLEDMEKHHIKSALEKHDWNRADTARALGISQKTLYTKIKKYNII